LLSPAGTAANILAATAFAMCKKQRVFTLITPLHNTGLRAAAGTRGLVFLPGEEIFL
jgi:hypothetical protein